jgi:hypothetical protein
VEIVNWAGTVLVVPSNCVPEKLAKLPSMAVSVIAPAVTSTVSPELS